MCNMLCYVMHIQYCDANMFMCCIEGKEVMYIDKTVMEEEAKKRGAHSLLLRDGMLDDWSDCGEEVGARGRVEASRELS